MKRPLHTEALRSRLLFDPTLPPPTAEGLIAQPEIVRLGLSSTDLAPVLSVAAGCPSVVACAVQLLHSAGITISWDGGTPALSPQHIGRWVHLIDDFDPDVLLCCELIENHPSVARNVADGHLPDFERWGFHIGCSNPDLDVVLAEGFADMHIHMAGTRQPADVWRRLVEGTLSISRATARVERCRINPPSVSARLREQLKESLEFRSQHVPTRALDPKAFAAQERQWCLRLAHALRGGDGDRHRTIVSFAEQAKRYFWVKHQLWRCLRQPQEGASPGLHEFANVWFKAVPRDNVLQIERPRLRQVARLSRPRLHRVVAFEHEAPMAMLLGQPNLRRVELRISPFDKAVAYSRFFKNWNLLERDIRKKIGRLPHVAFSVHLQRNQYHEKGLVQQLNTFDRQTAGLHLFRNRDQVHARRLARIDFAAVERDGPARMVGPLFRLLRGDANVIAALRDPELEAKRLFGAWRDLDARGLAAPGFGTTRLGASCHAGEDFGALLVGLKEVADAIEGMQLGEGDSIGHGLAMGWDPELFEHKFGWAASIAAGEILDALIWLRLQLDDDTTAEFERHWLNSVDEWISDRFKEIYGPDVKNPEGRADLSRYREASLWYPLRPSQDDNDSSQKSHRLVHQRYADPEIRKRFNARKQWSDCSERKLPAAVISWLQRRLRECCAERCIAIELHPSSNIRITGLATIHDSPTMTLLLADEAYPRAIGTDDPGVFSTNIACEYALVFAELTACKMSRVEARELLNRFRHEAMTIVRWPNDTASLDSEAVK